MINHDQAQDSEYLEEMRACALFTPGWIVTEISNSYRQSRRNLTSLEDAKAIVVSQIIGESLAHSKDFAIYLKNLPPESFTDKNIEEAGQEVGHVQRRLRRYQAASDFLYNIPLIDYFTIIIKTRESKAREHLVRLEEKAAVFEKLQRRKGILHEIYGRIAVTVEKIGDLSLRPDTIEYKLRVASIDSYVSQICEISSNGNFTRQV